MVNNLGSCSGTSPTFPQGKSLTSWIVTRLEKAYYSFLVLSFELTLAPWPMRTRMCLFTFNESSTFTSKVETRFMAEGNWTLDFIYFIKAAEHWILLFWGQYAWWHVTYLDSGEDRGFRLLIFLQPVEDGRFEDFTLSQSTKHGRAGKALARHWRLQLIEHRCIWVGLSIVILTIINLLRCDILYEGLLVLMSFWNPYGLGWYVTKSNFSHCNVVPLMLYDPLCVVKSIGLSLDYMPQRCWLTEVIAGPFH